MSTPSVLLNEEPLWCSKGVLEYSSNKCRSIGCETLHLSTVFDSKHRWCSKCLKKVLDRAKQIKKILRDHGLCNDICKYISEISLECVQSKLEIISNMSLYFKKSKKSASCIRVESMAVWK